MRRPGELLATSDNNKKTKIFTERFFPQPVLVNLSNITDEALVTHLRVNSNIITKEIAGTISRLLNNTVLGLDRILNKALKTCRPLIVPWFTDIAKACFTIGYYLRLRRAIIIFILRKKGKADYLFLGSYRPITLKNTLSKILKKVIADYIVNIAKKHALLL